MTGPNRPAPAGLSKAGLWPTNVPRPAAPVVTVPPAADRRELRQVGPGVQVLWEGFRERWPWHGVKWTVAYVGFLGYLFAITTYRFPIGNASMVIALLGLLLQLDKFRMPGILKGLGIFLLWCIAGYPQSMYPSLVLDRLEVVIKVWFVALVAANALRSRAQIRFMIFFWLGCFALYPVRGAIFNFYLYRESVAGRASWNYIFENPNDLAAYCVLMLSLAYGFLSLERKGPLRLATIAGLAVVPFLIVMTQSRGGFLGFGVFVLAIIGTHRKRGKAILAAGMIGVLVLAVAPDNVLNRVRGLEGVSSSNLKEADKEGSAFQRYEIWKVARTIIADHPIAGVGLGAYPAAHYRYSQRPQFDRTALGMRDTHSTYLNLAAETGFVGLAIYLLSYALTMLHVNRLRKRAKSVLPATSQMLYVYLVGALGFFVCCIFGSMAHVSFLLLHLIVTWAIADVVERELVAIRQGKLIVAPPEPVARPARAAS
jgi:O-antigen ligase